MLIAYDNNVDISVEYIATNVHRILNQTYRLLPLREEDQDWEKPLQTSIIELTGLLTLFPQIEEGLKVLSKMVGLQELGTEMCFHDFRRCVFECCNLLGQLEKSILEQEK